MQCSYADPVWGIDIFQIQKNSCFFSHGLSHIQSEISFARSTIRSSTRDDFKLSLFAALLFIDTSYVFILISSPYTILYIAYLKRKKNTQWTRIGSPHVNKHKNRQACFTVFHDLMHLARLCTLHCSAACLHTGCASGHTWFVENHYLLDIRIIKRKKNWLSI